MANKYISYTSKDYDSIRADLVNAIPGLTDIWTSRDQADPGMVNITLMAALGDNLSFNMDTQSLEFFGRTVTQRKNAQAIFDLVGYKMHWYKSAKLEIEINNTSLTESLSIPFGISSAVNARLISTIINTAPPYIILDDDLINTSKWDNPSGYNKVIPPNSSAKFIAVQGTLNNISFSSNDIDNKNRFYLKNSKLDQNYIWLKSGSYSNEAGSTDMRWSLVNNINELSDTKPAFEFNVDEYNLPYIEFVPYWRTMYIPEGTDVKFSLYYISTAGANGNVTSNILNYIPNAKPLGSGSLKSSEIRVVHGTNAYHTTNLNNVPGKDPETAREAYIATKRLIGTYNTLVTVKDFERFFLRLGNISNSLCIDGQRARDLNETIKEYYNKVVFGNSIPVKRLPESGTNSDDVYTLVEDQLSPDGSITYEAGSYVNHANSWRADKIIITTNFTSDGTPIVSNIDSRAKYVTVDINTEAGVATSSGLYMYLNNSWVNIGRVNIVNELPSTSAGIYYLICSDVLNIKSYDNKVYSYSTTNSWEKLDNIDENGFKPYMAEMHLVSSNFSETDPINSTIRFASSKPIVVENINGKDYGYMRYSLNDSIVGNDEDSEVNASGVNAYKLISADLEYGPVRKFPYFIDGKIHLKEPTTPQSANLVLRSVYNAIFNAFVSGKLKFGQKIGFADMIHIIDNANENIDYFDAGSNNNSGSLFIYPTVEDLNPYDVNEDNVIQNYKVNIDPKYFNPISLQHYEDILFQNNSYIYWGETASGHLSIAEDSIAYKVVPNLSNVYPRPELIFDDSGTSVIGFDLSNLTLTADMAMDQSLQRVKDKYFEYALLKEITTDFGPLYESPFDSGVYGLVYHKDNDKIWRPISEPMSNLITVGDTNNKTLWRYKNPNYDSSKPVDESNFEYIENTDNFVFAYRMIETLTTEQSSPRFGYIHVLAVDEEN